MDIISTHFFFFFFLPLALNLLAAFLAIASSKTLSSESLISNMRFSSSFSTRMLSNSERYFSFVFADSAARKASRAYFTASRSTRRVSDATQTYEGSVSPSRSGGIFGYSGVCLMCPISLSCQYSFDSRGVMFSTGRRMLFGRRAMHSRSRFSDTSRQRRPSHSPTSFSSASTDFAFVMNCDSRSISGTSPSLAHSISTARS
mmetsp:Transcript_11778/g.25856  ORF Transcript_11778/g.25856 Transcript_11778/m.25856 type:complete len:202 (-) Transcript_11778:1097-1702(-)